MRLLEILESCARDEGVWAELYAALELRRKLSDAEGKNMQRLHQTMTSEQAMGLLATAVGLVNKYIPDPAAFSEFSRELRTLSQGAHSRGGATEH